VEPCYITKIENTKYTNKQKIEPRQ